MVYYNNHWYEEIFIKAAKDGGACENPCGFCVAEFDTPLCLQLPDCDDLTDDGEDMMRWSVYDRIRK